MSKVCFPLITVFLKSVRTVLTTYGPYSFWIFRAPNPSCRCNHSSKYDFAAYRGIHFCLLEKKRKKFS